MFWAATAWPCAGSCRQGRQVPPTDGRRVSQPITQRVLSGRARDEEPIRFIGKLDGRGQGHDADTVLVWWHERREWVRQSFIQPDRYILVNSRSIDQARLAGSDVVRRAPSCCLRAMLHCSWTSTKHWVHRGPAP